MTAAAGTIGTLWMSPESAVEKTATSSRDAEVIYLFFSKTFSTLILVRIRIGSVPIGIQHRPRSKSGFSKMPGSGNSEKGSKTQDTPYSHL
jgi:hypothetical protein